MDIIHSDGNGNDDHHEYALYVIEVDPIHELETALHDTHLGQVENLESGNNFDFPSYDGSSIIGDENSRSADCNLDSEAPIATLGKCLQKCPTFPIAVKAETTIESQSESKSCKRSESFPSERKLISALKGSREKEGVPPRKLSVSWAPDVYDPPPTSSSHYPKKKPQQGYKYVKKHGKGKQKGKNVRGGGSGPKDKKHQHKTGRRSDRCLDSFADSDRVISSSNKYSSVDILDFNDDINIGRHGSPESNCSSNFLGQAGGTMHCVC